jgi:hypothetical protein
MAELAAEKAHGRREPLIIGDDEVLKLEHFYIPEHYKDDVDGLLVPHGTINDRIEKLAYDISLDYIGKTIHLLCVLKGIYLYLLKFPLLFVCILIFYFMRPGGSTFFSELCNALRKFHDCK